MLLWNLHSTLITRGCKLYKQKTFETTIYLFKLSRVYYMISENRKKSIIVANLLTSRKSYISIVWDSETYNNFLKKNIPLPITCIHSHLKYLTPNFRSRLSLKITSLHSLQTYCTINYNICISYIKHAVRQRSHASLGIIISHKSTLHHSQIFYLNVAMFYMNNILHNCEMWH